MDTCALTQTPSYQCCPFIEGFHLLQAETRKIYQTLVDEETEFTGVDIRSKYILLQLHAHVTSMTVCSVCVSNCSNTVVAILIAHPFYGFPMCARREAWSESPSFLIHKH